MAITTSNSTSVNALRYNGGEAAAFIRGIDTQLSDSISAPPTADEWTCEGQCSGRRDERRGVRLRRRNRVLNDEFRNVPFGVIRGRGLKPFGGLTQAFVALHQPAEIAARVG